MGAVLQADDLGDLVATTQRALGKMNFTEIATDTQEHVAWSSLIKKKKMKVEAGYGQQFDVMVDHNHSARFVGLGAQDVVNQIDVMIQGYMPYRHCTHNYSVEGREIDMNVDPAKIVDIVTTRRIAAMISLVEKMEERFWKLPAVTDKVNPWGVPYWIVKQASSTGAFNTTLPSGYSDVASIVPATYPRWANWACNYTDVTDDDLLEKWWEAADKTKFMPPVDGIPTFNTGDQYGFYTNYSVRTALKQLVKAQNENIGSDLDAYNDSIVFRKVPVKWVPALDADTTGVVYGINWGVFGIGVLRNWWLKETQLKNQPGQHTIAVTHVDCSFNLKCYDRRKQFVLSTGTDLP